MTSGYSVMLHRNLLLKNTFITRLCRKLSLQEYICMDVLRKSNINVAKGFAVSSPEEAYKLASENKFKDYVVKAQVLSGGRGKGQFKNGLKSGIQLTQSSKSVKEIVEQMLGKYLVTKQTGPAGLVCSHAYICERLYPRREFYMAFTLDRKSAGPILIGSTFGGVNIEETAAMYPNSIKKYEIDINKGIDPETLSEFLNSLDFTPELIPEAVDQLTKAYQLVVQNDLTLLELNPFCETHDGHVFAIDCKMQVDDNALYRHSNLSILRDYSQEKESDVLASKTGINYVGLDGTIGCLVNGAGLAMATLDIIKLNGGTPANFLDIGGGATISQVVSAFEIILSDKNVKAILVNIFGGIMRCDIIAQGILQAVETLKVNVPMVIRLQGTNILEAKLLFAESKLKIIAIDDLEEASKMVVKLASIVKIAHEANIEVQFELPI